VTVNPPATEPGNAVHAHGAAPTTVRIATWSARHRWLVFVLWFVATLGTFAVSAAVGGIKTQSATGNGGVASTESAQGLNVFSNAIGQKTETDSLTVVVSSPTLKVTDPPYQAAVADIVARLRGITNAGATVFPDVIDPLQQPPALGLVSPDLTSVRLTATGMDVVVADASDAVRQGLAAIRTAHPDLVIHGVSIRLINEDVNEVVSSDLDSSLKITIPATFAILLIAFGTVAAAVVPLVLAITALLAAFGLLGIYSQLLSPVSPYATQLVVLIGLAVAVDYSLFMITRFRTERRRGVDTQHAIEIASGTAGRAVFFSGLAVMISVAALYILPDELFHSMALGTIAVILVAVVGSLTFLPATLSILGGRVNAGRIPWFGRERPEESGFWSRLVRAVMRRPAITAASATLALLLLASPILQFRLGSTDITAFPESIDGVQAIEQLREHWPQGSTLTLDVFVTRADQTAQQAAISQLQAKALQIPGLSPAGDPTLSGDGTVADVAFVMGGTLNDPANHAIVREMRTTVVPAVFGGLPDVRVYVSGEAARALDATKIYADALPLVFAFVLGLSFILLLVAFRSLVIPIKAILLNLLSTGAAYGVLVLIFQEGWFKDVLHVRVTDVIEAWVPIFIFAILFGLSMDYHVFILTRIKEMVDRGMGSNAAVAHGISATSGTVTSAAAIMVVVFGIFATLRLVIIRELGLGLAVAVLVDATIIRSVLLPASMRLLGEWNWYLPRALGWLPRVTLEVETEAPAT
jgi:RND superfamily putative drug exporter